MPPPPPNSARSAPDVGSTFSARSASIESPPALLRAAAAAAASEASEASEASARSAGLSRTSLCELCCHCGVTRLPPSRRAAGVVRAAPMACGAHGNLGDINWREVRTNEVCAACLRCAAPPRPPPFRARCAPRAPFPLPRAPRFRARPARARPRLRPRLRVLQASAVSFACARFPTDSARASLPRMRLASARAPCPCPRLAGVRARARRPCVPACPPLPAAACLPLPACLPPCPPASLPPSPPLPLSWERPC
jgi:hypothetical protein